MNLILNLIVTYTKRLTFVLVVFAMVVKPLIETITFLNDSNYELVSTDLEIDTIDEEHQEEENKTETEGLQLVNSFFLQTYNSFSNTNYLYYSSLNSSFEIVINIPPPDLV